MAGGVNPFGFSMGVLPAPRAPRQPKDLPSAPFGFTPPPSKMQQTLAILNEYNPLPAFERLLKSPMALGGPISEQDIADGLMVAGTVTGGSAAAPKPRNALNMGFRVFHGSPHDFPPVRLIEMADGTRLYQNMGELADTPQGAKIIQEYPMGRFDLSKIGTGEGAQAYGHGLYFAEAEDVARGYRDKLSMGSSSIDGRPMSEIAAEKHRLPYGQQPTIEHDIADIVDSYGDNARPVMESRYPGLLATYDKMVADGRVSAGRMYEVEINADPDAFLDWDKPLSADAPQAVKDAFNKIANSDPVLKEKFHQAFRDQQPGNIYYSILNDHARTGDLVKNQTFATEKLREAGIPGIKYLDAGSRGAGDGTRNYVVFDDNLISIVRKYGIAGASAMLGYNILDGMDPAQADELKRIEGNQ